MTIAMLNTSSIEEEDLLTEKQNPQKQCIVWKRDIKSFGKTTTTKTAVVEKCLQQIFTSVCSKIPRIPEGSEHLDESSGFPEVKGVCVCKAFE